VCEGEVHAAVVLAGVGEVPENMNRELVDRHRGNFYGRHGFAPRTQEQTADGD
jgi:hypothetical protein